MFMDYKKWKENDMKEVDMDVDDSNEIAFFIGERIPSVKLGEERKKEMDMDVDDSNEIAFFIAFS